jgi:DAACS family dicarboxylate/amino acid:cation (Na+ or H+) symporter
MLAGVAAGAVLGVAANALAADSASLAWVVANVADPIGQIFLRLLKMLVVPLLFSALVVGACELELRSLGRVGVLTLAYTLVFSTIAVVIGLVLVNVIQPGAGAGEELRAMAAAAEAPAAAREKPASAVALLVSLVPENPLAAAAGGDFLGLIVFSLIFGVALSLTPGEAAGKLKDFVKGLYDVLMTLLGGVLKVAPLGVAALLFSTTARLGHEIFLHLGAYILVVLAGLGLHMFGVYSLSVWLLGGLRPREFFYDVRLAMITAFSTASSAATLPTALQVAEENLRLPTRVSRFVLTAGSAMNQNGTALFEGVTVLFLAQLFGVPLSLGEQATVMGICILAGVGTAGVPAGSIPVIAMILGMFHIPVEGLGLIIGVDRILDMCRTTLNVTGDLAAAVFVAKNVPATSSDS